MKENTPDGPEIVYDLNYISDRMGDYPLWQGVVDRSMAVINDLSSQRDALVAALERYGRHTVQCDQIAYLVAHNSGHPQQCTCGFGAALKAAKGEA